MTLFVGLFLLIAANLILLQTLSWTVLFIPYVILLQLMFTAGIGNFQNSCRLKQNRFALLEA